VERAEIQAGGKSYEYYVGDTTNPKLYGIRWLQDGYLFELSIPEEYIVNDGKLDEALLLKYTELDEVIGHYPGRDVISIYDGKSDEGG
jgi:hypothetical protein